MLIQLNNVSKNFGENVVLKNINLSIYKKSRYGLIGVNGAGKSTLLNIICRNLDYDDGSIDYSNSVSIGFLKQDSGLNTSNTIKEEMLSVFSHIFIKQNELVKLTKELQEINTESDEYKCISKKYSEIQSYIELNDGYSYEVKINTILNGMGFQDKDPNTTIINLSGGEKTRLALAKLLLEEPNLLILDEPTNHLDFHTLIWLEDYLKSYNGAIIIVSHDRYFLDRTVSDILELERNILTKYTGNYSKYVMLKEEKIIRAEKDYVAQQKEIEKMEDYVRRNIARASTSSSAKSRVKTLEKMDKIEAPIRYKSKIKLRFEKYLDPYTDLLEVKDVCLSIGEKEKILSDHINLSMKKGEKIAIVGRNGVGKTTFLKALQNMIKIKSGKIKWGMNAKISYYEQETRHLNPNKTVIDELWDKNRDKTELEIRNRLASVGFTGETVFKKVAVLSGGEKAKLKFCIISFQPSNVLLMDEPTNHLDLTSKEILEDALFNYDGSLIFVSHDRYLLNKIPTKIIELTEDGINEYLGNYENYINAIKNKQMTIKQEEIISEEKTEKSDNSYYKSKKQRSLEAQRKNRVAKIEQEVDSLEKEIYNIEQEMLKEEVFSDYKTMTEKSETIEKIRSKILLLMEEWENLINQ